MEAFMICPINKYLKQKYKSCTFEFISFFITLKRSVFAEINYLVDLFSPMQILLHFSCTSFRE